MLLEGDLESPRGIAVHPGVGEEKFYIFTTSFIIYYFGPIFSINSFWIKGRMFWTDWDRLGPKIEAANMDGTERMVQQRLKVQ